MRKNKEFPPFTLKLFHNGEKYILWAEACAGKIVIQAENLKELCERVNISILGHLTICEQKGIQPYF